MLRRRAAAAAGVMVALVGVLGACSGTGSGAGSQASAQDASPAPYSALLGRTVQTLDSAKTVHFSVTSQDVPEGAGSTKLIKGEGVLTRPTPTTGAFRGSTELLINNRRTVLKLISYRDTVYMQLDGSSQYQVVDPVSFGLFDPAVLVKAKTGISSLVVGMKSVQDKGSSEVDGTTVHTLQGEVTGLLARRVLPIADVYKPVGITLQIDEATAQLRQVGLTGYFFTPTDKSDYLISLSRWNKKATITSPAT